MLGFIGTIIIAFMSSNLDDLFILTVFYAQATTKRERQNILFGQMLGLGLIFLISVICISGLRAVKLDYLNLLGFIPLFIGVKQLVQALATRCYKKQVPDQPVVEKVTKISLPIVSAVTVSNCADNMGIYIPLFSSYTWMQLGMVFVGFMCLVPIWCFFGAQIAAQPHIKLFIQRYQKFLVPAVFIGIGLAILKG